jgi:TPR repeat protein
MAVEKGDSYGMFNLGNYYKEIKDYQNMEKYYLMAIKKGDRDAINNLVLFYQNNK